MIRSFRCSDTERLFHGERTRRFPPDIVERARMRLQRLNAAIRVEDLRVPPSHRLELLKGDRAGQWSIRVNDQWRLCFAWKDGDAWLVEIVDYH